MAGWVREDLNRIKPYRPGKRISEVQRELGLASVVKLSSNESPLPPFESARRAMAKAVNSLNRYPDSGCRFLKEKLSAALDTRKTSVAVGNGSNELIRLVAQAVLDPGDEVIMAVPSFVVYPIVVDLMGAVSVQVPLKNHKHDLQNMADRISDRTRLIFVCSPNNPTGTIAPADEVDEFMKSIPENILICFDEAYHEYVVDPAYRTALSLREEHHNVIVFRTFSKIYGLAGARVGYGIMPAEVVDAIDKIREPFNVNTLAQIGAGQSLDDREEVEKRCTDNRRQMDVVESALDRMGLARSDSQANFVYFNPGRSAVEAFEKLQGQGVIVRVLGDGGFIRATLGTAEENRRFIKALDSLERDG